MPWYKRTINTPFFTSRLKAGSLLLMTLVKVLFHRIKDQSKLLYHVGYINVFHNFMLTFVVDVVIAMQW